MQITIGIGIVILAISIGLVKPLTATHVVTVYVDGTITAMLSTIVWEGVISDHLPCFL
jgi:hypothetical protein